MPAELSSILRLEVPIVVQIGTRSLPLDEVTALAPGAIIELPKGADEELELLVNNKAIGSGVAVKVGENFGIRISFLGDVRARIQALGGRSEPVKPGTTEPAAAAAAASDAMAEEPVSAPDA